MTTATSSLPRRVSWRLSSRDLPLVLVVLCALMIAACGSTQELVNQQQRALVSLTSTVIAVSNAWLEGNVSTRYARTALEATAALLEKERASIGASPDTLVDPRLASLSESQNTLARQIGVLRKALADSDAATIRQQIAAIGLRQGQLR